VGNFFNQCTSVPVVLRPQPLSYHYNAKAYQWSNQWSTSAFQKMH
jgi:hypothetical protein